MLTPRESTRGPVQARRFGRFDPFQTVNGPRERRLPSGHAAGRWYSPPPLRAAAGNPRRQRSLNQMHFVQQSRQPAPLYGCFQIAPGLVDGMARRQELHTIQPPKSLQGRPRSPGGGEQDIGVQENSIHASDPGRFVVRDRLRIQTHTALFSGRTTWFELTDVQIARR